MPGESSWWAAMKEEHAAYVRKPCLVTFQFHLPHDRGANPMPGQSSWTVAPELRPTPEKPALTVHAQVQIYREAMREMERLITTGGRCRTGRRMTHAALTELLLETIRNAVKVCGS